MKKLFTLLTLALVSIGSAWAAGDEFLIKFQNSKSITESPSGYFTYNKGEGTAVSWSSKGKHSCTYGGDTYSDVIKMEGATQCYFTTSSEATVTIVQTTSNATGDKLKFDGYNLNADLANTTVTVDATNKYNEYVITGVAAGKHTITRQSETGLAYVKVVYTGNVLTQLGTPVISFNSTTGEVTISAVANASKVTYTTNGTDPSAESTTYAAPFTVEDGTVVKAIAIGDQSSYSNSDIASETVLLANVTPEAPVINQFNGTVYITCATANTTIEYSLDGTNYTAFTRAFTLSEDATIYAKAKRGETYSEVASAVVTTIGKGTATKTIWMGHGSFDNNDQNSMTGKSGDDAEGFTLTITGNDTKKWSSGIDKININGIERTTIKLSNGAQNTLTFPEGVKATRITFYSIINSAAARTSYWKEFNGTNIAGEDMPMGAWNTVEDRLTIPDVRVFELTGDETSITFTNAGEQLLFVIALDVIEGPVPVTITDAEYATYVNTEHALDFSETGITVYTATAGTTKVTLNEIAGGKVPANTPVVLYKANADGTAINVPVIASADAIGSNDLEVSNGSDNLNGKYVLANKTQGVGFYKWGGTTIPAGKVYLNASAASAPEFLGFGSEATGISAVQNAQSTMSNEVYNLNGQRVAQPTKGLYITNGRKVVVK